jgi:hypothetical protein
MVKVSGLRTMIEEVSDKLGETAQRLPEQYRFTD